MKRHENAIFIIWPLDKIIGFGIIEIYRKVSIRCENEQMMSGGKSIICIIMCMLHLYVKKEKMLELIKKCGQAPYFDQIKQRAAGRFNMSRLNSASV